LYAPQVVAQIRQESPNIPVFIQLSLLPRKSTPQITANDIYTLDGKRVNNFLPYYNQTSSVQYTTLQQFFSLLPRSVPQPPTNLTASAVSSSQINLSWSAPANSNYSAITGYKVERVTGNSTTWENVTSNTDSNATLYSDIKLEHSTTYTYRVSAINQMGTSYQSKTTFATTFNTVPQPPTGLTATAKILQIDLSWNAPSDNGGSAITGYMLERSTDNGNTWSGLVANTGNTGTTYSDTNVLPLTTYTYRVSAINDVGTSDPSNTASATTPTVGPVTPPSLP
jgi:fibronectin type 3 domain-containing protein